jgi:hypothetical protein
MKLADYTTPPACGLWRLIHNVQILTVVLFAIALPVGVSWWFLLTTPVWAGIIIVLVYARRQCP